jgi:hypothetical protein
MKKSNILALVAYKIGILYMLDWLLFVEKNNDLVDDFPTLKEKYIARFPDVIKPLLEANPQPAAILFTLLFCICGIVFIRNNNLVFKILGITSFLFAFWNLFSIM